MMQYLCAMVLGNKSKRSNGNRDLTCRFAWLGIIAILLSHPLDAQDARVLEIENIVQSTNKGTSSWNSATKEQSLAVGDRIRTRQRSRATVGLTGLFTVRLDQFTTIQITPALVNANKPRLDFSGGAAFIFSREKTGEMDVKMPGANAALRGTQLFVRVDENGKSEVQVLEGQVELNNSHGRLVLNTGEAGEAVTGRAPRRTAVIEANNLLQWALYYPAVVDPADLYLTADEKARFAKSIACYEKGDLLEAVSRLPEGAPAGKGGRLYQAAALLSVGRVDESGKLVASVPVGNPGRRAVDRMITAVKGRGGVDWAPMSIGTASEAMAESYFQQSKANLATATDAARKATAIAPQNGFAWTRLAELEFSAGRTREAHVAIEIAARFSPANARLHALRGFVLCAENRIAEGAEAFQKSVSLDGSFGNGWLGLGLTKIKRGDLVGGRMDIQTAATVEPTSSIFHSYLGKAMSQDGRSIEAMKDLELARLLDSNDPTPLLYLALENQRNNQPNAAIGNLQESIRLNDNRRLYRSEFLLDQDRAVRSANLARIYQNAGMKDVAVREATRAVESDYSNASAHLFLANSFDAIRDPDRTLLRYETPWFNELLLSNLLAPVGGGPLSQFVSQQEYSKLLEADGVGASLLTQWSSNDELRTTASAFGTHGNMSYGLDASYRNDDGSRINSDIELKELYGQVKWQPTSDDIFYFLGKWSGQKQGDLFETYNNLPLSENFRFEENQEPGLLLGGWNHRWRPGSNTLFLFGRLAATQSLIDQKAPQLLVLRDNSGLQPGFMQLNSIGRMSFTDPSLDGGIAKIANDHYTYSPAVIEAIQPYLGSGDVLEEETEIFDFLTRRKFEILTGEVQQIERMENHTMLLGGRWQHGTIESQSRMIFKGQYTNAILPTPAADQQIDSDFTRLGLYAYDYWQVMPTLSIVSGLSWDYIDHPENFRNPPLSDRQRTDEALSGKLGFTWSPSEWFTLRGAAAQGLGGLTYDESVRLEPSQIAGFGQAYRTIISESIAGSVETPNYSILGLAAEGWMPTRTWWGASCGLMEQNVRRSVGMFTGYDDLPSPSNPVYFADQTRENLDYRELYLNLGINQLIGNQYSLGATWNITRSELDTTRPELGPLFAEFSDIATLSRISLFADWNSPTGFYAHVEVNSYSQDLNRDETYLLPNRDGDAANDVAPRKGDDFIQLNAWAGYRFKDNLCELAVGVMNIGDSGFSLSPLNPYSDIARERTVFATLRVSF